MERILYIVRMNNKPNVPEEIWRTSLKTGGGWMNVAILTDIAGYYLIEHHKDWPLALRLVIAVIPLVAGLFFVRSTARWIRGMDELHRRLVLEACLFGTVAYLFLSAAWFLLNHAGAWEAIALVTSLHLERMPFSNGTCIISLTWILFGVGYTRLARRYL